MSQEKKRRWPLSADEAIVPTSDLPYTSESIQEEDSILQPQTKKQRISEEEEEGKKPSAPVEEQEDSSKMGQLLQAVESSREASTPAMAQTALLANRTDVTTKQGYNETKKGNFKSEETQSFFSSEVPAKAAAPMDDEAAILSATIGKERTKDSDDDSDGQEGYEEDSDLPKKNDNGFTRTFPQRLMDVISRSDTDKALMWAPDGLSFVIISPRTFVAKVLPRFFKQSKFASFTRKLNRWGFKRLTTGPNAGAYYHQLFQRDKPELCSQMYCHKTGAPMNEQLRLQLLLQLSSQYSPNMAPALPDLSRTGRLPPVSLGAVSEATSSRSTASLQPALLQSLRRTSQDQVINQARAAAYAATNSSIRHQGGNPAPGLSTSMLSSQLPFFSTPTIRQQQLSAMTNTSMPFASDSQTSVKNLSNREAQQRQQEALGIAAAHLQSRYGPTGTEITSPLVTRRTQPPFASQQLPPNTPNLQQAQRSSSPAVTREYLDTAMLAMVRRQRDEILRQPQQVSTPIGLRKNTLAETRRLLLSAYERNLTTTSSISSQPLPQTHPMQLQSPFITSASGSDVAAPADARTNPESGKAHPTQQQQLRRGSPPPDSSLRNRYARGA